MVLEPVELNLGAQEIEELPQGATAVGGLLFEFH